MGKPTPKKFKYSLTTEEVRSSYIQFSAPRLELGRDVVADGAEATSLPARSLKEDPVDTPKGNTIFNCLEHFEKKNHQIWLENRNLT